MIPSPIIWGLLLGLGSSLHCAGMCGPIGCTLMMATPGATDRRSLLVRIATMQLGRVTAYAGLGLVFGLVGASLYASLDLSALHQAMQWVAALVVIWMGLATAGMVPALAGADRLLAPIAGRLARYRMAASAGGPEAALATGLIWGLTPCAMVYAAIFNSLLTGDAWMGTLLMLSFGIGTIPAVVIATLALVKAAGRRHRRGRIAAGAMLIGAGVLGLLLTVPGSPLCITPAWPPG
jgi:sulfite exporter TauE/SafE